MMRTATKLLLVMSVILQTSFCVAQQQRIIDIAREPVVQLSPGMTSLNMSIYGVRLGMMWSDARDILARTEVPYLFSKTIPITVYIAPSNATFYFTLNPSSYEIIEMGVMGSAQLPLENRYLSRGNYWWLTTARTHFFGSEGHDVLNEEARSFMYESRGFALKFMGNDDFRFVLFYPSGWKPIPPPPVVKTPEPYVSRIPFFVTGYYYPNTSINYRWLRNRMESGELKEAGYIDIKDEDYENLARKVDAELEQVYSYIESNLRHLLQAGVPDLHIEATVYGFVDPRNLTKGKYLDSTIVNEIVRIKQGDVLEGDEGNKRLAILRAYHTRNMIDEYMSQKSSLYSEMKSAGRVHWRAAGKGISKKEQALREMRSIELHIRFQRR